jgi:hypothetical protein
MLNRKIIPGHERGDITGKDLKNFSCKYAESKIYPRKSLPHLSLALPPVTHEKKRMAKCAFLKI